MKRFLIIFLFFGKLYSQDQGEFKNLTLEKCIELSLKRNLSLEIAKLEEAQGNLLVNAALEIPKTSFFTPKGKLILFTDLIITIA